MSTIITNAEAWRLLQATRLLQSEGFYQHSDGAWHPEPEPTEDDWPED